MRSVPPYHPSLRIMAQDLQGRTEDNRGASRRVRRRCYKKEYRCSMARGRFSRGARLMATGVVLHHLSSGHHLGSASRLSLGPPTTFNIVDQHRLDRGLPKDVPLLQGRIKDLLQGDLNLVKVTQVMLIRRTLPGQRRPLRLWEFNPEGPRALRNFMGVTPMEMYKLFFGSQEVSPDLTEDAGLSRNRPDTQVGDLVPGPFIRIIDLLFNNTSPFKQEWIAKAKLIRCPAPLPETRLDPVLVRMLEVAPLEGNEGADKETGVSSKEAIPKGGIDNSSPKGKKRAASDVPGAVAPKRGKASTSESAARETPSAELNPQREQPSNEP